MSGTKTASVTFRLTEGERKLLDSLAGQDSRKKSKVVRKALYLLAECQQSSKDTPLREVFRRVDAM